MKSGSLVCFPDDEQYVHRGKLFLVLKLFKWESPYNGAVFSEVDVLECGTAEMRKFRCEYLQAVLL